MNWNEYLSLSEKTLSKQFNCEIKEQLLLHACIGSLTEIEELLENYNEDGQLLSDVNKQGSVAEESADIFWYLAILFRELNINEVVIDIQERTPFGYIISFLKDNLKMLDLLKKKLYYNKEMGNKTLIDLSLKMYYTLHKYCESYNTDVSSILEKNINKLKARYGEKFSSEMAINRDLEKEKQILENE